MLYFERTHDPLPRQVDRTKMHRLIGLRNKKNPSFIASDHILVSIRHSNGQLREFSAGK